MKLSTKFATGFVALGTITALVGCAATASETAPSTAVAAQADSVSIEDAWVKSAEEGMSAAFGILSTDGAEVTVISASTAASPMIELHETVAGDDGQMMMQEKDGGFVVSEVEMILAPGGDHLMLMGLTAPLLAGDTVGFELTMEDGSIFSFDAPVKDYSGANETYNGDESVDIETDSDSGSADDRGSDTRSGSADEGAPDQ
ncbi:copper chaperone PCu(A)C [Arthrobacter sp. TMT4-20]